MTNLRSHTDFRSSVVPKKLHNYETWRYWEKGDKKWNGTSTYIYASLYGATWKLKFRMILLSCLLISRLHTQWADILWSFRLGFSKDCWKILMIVMCLITSCLAHNPPERSFFLNQQIFFELTRRTDNEVFIHFIFMENSFSFSTALGFPMKFSMAGVFAPGAKGGMTVTSSKVILIMLFHM